LTGQHIRFWSRWPIWHLWRHFI